MCAHHTGGTDHFSCSPQPHLHSYKEAFEEMEGASPTSPPPGGGEIPPPNLAFPVSPQTPYSNPSKCYSSGRRRGSVGGSWQARNLLKVRQLRAPDTHCSVNHSSSPSSSSLYPTTPHCHYHPAAVCIPWSVPFCCLFSYSPLTGVFLGWDPKVGKEERQGLKDSILPPRSCPAPPHPSYQHGKKGNEAAVADK